MKKKEDNITFKKIWYFIWEDNSIWSWLVNIILAFVLIKFIVYPGLGFILNTSHPVVAVVSSSMEHKSVSHCLILDNTFNKNLKYCSEYEYTMCGNTYDEDKIFKFDDYWNECGEWYGKNANLDKKDFSEFTLKNGFNKGDIMVLAGKDASAIEVGDVIVFRSSRQDPIIHRVVNKFQDNNRITFQTKGDNNNVSINTAGLNEMSIEEDAIIGKAVFRIPLLGYIKIWFVELLRLMGFVQ